MWAANSYLSAGHLAGCQNAPPSWPKRCLLVFSCNMVSRMKSSKTLTASRFHSGTDSRQIFSLSHPMDQVFIMTLTHATSRNRPTHCSSSTTRSGKKNTTLFWMLANTADPFSGAFLASADKGHPMGLVNETEKGQLHWTVNIIQYQSMLSFFHTWWFQVQTEVSPLVASCIPEPDPQTLKAKSL